MYSLRDALTACGFLCYWLRLSLLSLLLAGVALLQAAVVTI